MPWFRHPLTWQIGLPDPTGPLRLRLRSVIPIEIERAPGDWFEVPTVIVDSGASYTILSAAWARSNGILLPSVTHTLPLLTAAGRRVMRAYDVDLTVRFRRMPEQPFSLAALVSDDYPPSAPPLLGLHNLLNS